MPLASTLTLANAAAGIASAAIEAGDDHELAHYSSLLFLEAITSIAR
jgi:hypothetical protein